MRVQYHTAFMSKLRNRQMQIPQGLTFYQPETRWRPQRYASFETIVRSLIAHRQAHPHLVEKHRWPIDYATVCEEVDSFNARVCEANGWNQYITGPGGDSLPKSMPPQLNLLQRGQQLAAGAGVLVEWISSGAEAVSAELANRRASVCAACVQNEKGDLLSFFTKPVSAAIQGALNARREMRLSTPNDENLGVCAACSCPLKLKVHIPLDRIMAKLTAESKAGLDANCWILKGDQ